jgi:hypothetical protein
MVAGRWTDAIGNEPEPATVFLRELDGIK